MILAGLSMMYLMSQISNGASMKEVGFSYLMLTNVLCIDAFYGLLKLLAQEEFCQRERELENQSVNILNQYFVNNWKASQIMSVNIKVKMLAFICLFLEVFLSMAAL